MISIKDKSRCCGCSACMMICPKHCIKMVQDDEGFYYPTTDERKCIKCGLCDSVCPMYIHKQGTYPINCFAAQANNYLIRKTSSSGGAFTLLAEKILRQGGVVFGARFNDSFQVIHSYAETIEALAPFRGSKYSQSYINNAYLLVNKFLIDKRPVLFTGTPCQVAGLQKFLKKDFENLYSVSVVCHGAPSPKVWDSYLNKLLEGEKAKEINMRDKETGWKNYSLTVETVSGRRISSKAMSTSYMKAFIGNLILRPSCYECPFRGNHGSDVTIGDFWGIERVLPEIDDDYGTSLILVYTEKGRDLLDSVDWALYPVKYVDALQGNPVIEKLASVPSNRKSTFKSFKSNGYAAIERGLAFDRKRKNLRTIVELFLRKFFV